MTGRPVALVTGAARRVGRQIALELARAGCDLILTSREPDHSLDAFNAELAALGATTTWMQIDLNAVEETERSAADLARTLPRLDVLVHNASIYSPTPLDALTAVQALDHYRVNTLAPLLLTKHLARLLARCPLPAGGAIVAMADMHATGRPRAGFSAYSMSKAALIEMVYSLARELAPSIRVNAIAPGVIAWPESGYESDEAMQRDYLRRVPLKRAGTPDDAARMVKWLALDAHYITGEVIRLDGGRWLA